MKKGFSKWLSQQLNYRESYATIELNNSSSIDHCIKEDKDLLKAEDTIYNDDEEDGSKSYLTYSTPIQSFGVLNRNGREYDPGLFTSNAAGVLHSEEYWRKFLLDTDVSDLNISFTWRDVIKYFTALLELGLPASITTDDGSHFLEVENSNYFNDENSKDKSIDSYLIILTDTSNGNNLLSITFFKRSNTLDGFEDNVYIISPERNPDIKCETVYRVNINTRFKLANMGNHFPIFPISKNEEFGLNSFALLHLLISKLIRSTRRLL